MALIDLKAWNQMVGEQTHDFACNEPKKNGIKCPNGACKAELFDATPNMILTSMPPQKRIICKRCGWTGTRLA
jgi:hypothetical protein